MEEKFSKERLIVVVHAFNPCAWEASFSSGVITAWPLVLALFTPCLEQKFLVSILCHFFHGMLDTQGKQLATLSVNVLEEI